MYQFSIRDIENLSGIKAHTLRIWEQRYQLILCKRKDSQHRFYDNEDLKQILRIAYLYNKGYKISKIAGLSKEQISEIASSKKSAADTELLINQMMEASLDMDSAGFEKIIHQAILNLGIEQFIHQAAFPFMEKIGLLWITNHIIPAQEHFSSHQIHKKLIAAIDCLPSVPKKPDIYFLLFTPSGEQHELSLLFKYYLLKKKGYHVTLMGRNSSVEMLEYYCKRRPVTHLYFHLITNFTSLTVNNYLDQLAGTFPEKKIIAAGPAVLHANPACDNVTILRSSEEMAMD
jgi:MerR family transcriptional regulator, light-induced transcriptional regulator